MTYAFSGGSLATFYAAAFSAHVGDRYENPAKGFASRFVTFEDSARLEFMTSRTAALRPTEFGAQRMGLTHIAISLRSEAAVD